MGLLSIQERLAPSVAAITLGLSKVIAVNEKAKEELADLRKEHQDIVKKYDVKLPEIKKEAEDIEKEAKRS